MTREASELQDGDGSNAGKWRGRRPRWLIVEKAALDAQWRDSQRAHRPWAALHTPQLDFAAIAPPVKVRSIGD